MPPVQPDPLVSQGSRCDLGPQSCQGSARQGQKGLGPRSKDWRLPGTQSPQFLWNDCRLCLRARGGAERHK